MLTSYSQRPWGQNRYCDHCIWWCCPCNSLPPMLVHSHIMPFPVTFLFRYIAKCLNHNVHTTVTATIKPLNLKQIGVWYIWNTTRATEKRTKIIMCILPDNKCVLLILFLFEGFWWTKRFSEKFLPTKTSWCLLGMLLNFFTVPTSKDQSYINWVLISGKYLPN